jgi:hypothetical protein
MIDCPPSVKESLQDFEIELVNEDLFTPSEGDMADPGIGERIFTTKGPPFCIL